jgi:hypothetical protein
MADDDKVSLNLPCVGTNFVGGLTSHHLCDRIKTELLQSGNAFIKDVGEGVLYLNGGSGVSYIRQQKCGGVDEDR